MKATATVPPSLAESTNPALIALSAAAENALTAALRLLRDPAGTAADLTRAAARVGQAELLLQRACAAPEGGAA